MKLTATEIAKHVKGKVVGDGAIQIIGVAALENVGQGHVVFAQDLHYFREAEKTQAIAIIAPDNLTSADKTVIQTDNPRHAFAQVMQLFYPQEQPASGIHPTAVIGENVKLGKEITIAPYVVIDDDVEIGDKVRIGAGSVISKSCKIGEKTQIAPNVTIYHRTQVGSGCILHAGCVIGADGFGFVQTDAGQQCKLPQCGHVQIGNNVEIGSNTCVDRGTLGATVISNGTKIDNQVQIGHNTMIGKNCIICSQAAIAGSCILKDNVILAGEVGISDHAVIESGAILGGRTGVASGKRLKGQTIYLGAPAKPVHDTMRILACIAKLPQNTAKLKTLQHDIEKIQKHLDKLQGSGEA